jgi:hypothetical protein
MSHPGSGRRAVPFIGLATALAAALLLGGCAGVPGGSSAATSREWVAMTAPRLPSLGLPSLSVESSGGPVTELSAPATRAHSGASSDDGDGFVHGLLLYIPNRIFDILDIVRARVRVGPGFGLDVRATELADLYLGAYTSVFVGIPGPRLHPEINWPFGLETNVGAEASVADASTEDSGGPTYGHAEFGVGLHVLLVGVDIGVDPWELVDFATGILTIDLVGDDL